MMNTLTKLALGLMGNNTPRLVGDNCLGAVTTTILAG
jgi:hypothetical protein